MNLRKSKNSNVVDKLHLPEKKRKNTFYLWFFSCNQDYTVYNYDKIYFCCYDTSKAIDQLESQKYHHLKPQRQWDHYN